MKRFIIQLLVFFLPPVSYFGINHLINSHYLSTSTLDLQQANVLIVGDSHPQRSLDPALFHTANNVCMRAEPYVLTFWKLRRILKTHRPDTLLIGFAPHNISSFNDLKFSDEFWSAEMFRRCYPIQDLDHVHEGIKVDRTEYYRTVFKETAFYPKREHIHFLGNYANSPTYNISDWEETVNRHFFWNGEKMDVSIASVSYLDSMIHLCNRNDIVPVLFSSPVYAGYLRNIPEDIMTEFNHLCVKYAAEGIPVFDRTTDSYPDSLFFNSDHLNSHGAARFSAELREWLGTQGQL